jgi:hypothetical protein
LCLWQKVCVLDIVPIGVVTVKKELFWDYLGELTIKKFALGNAKTGLDLNKHLSFDRETFGADTLGEIRKYMAAYEKFFGEMGNLAGFEKKGDMNSILSAFTSLEKFVLFLAPPSTDDQMMIEAENSATSTPENFDMDTFLNILEEC